MGEVVDPVDRVVTTRPSRGVDVTVVIFGLHARGPDVLSEVLGNEFRGHVATVAFPDHAEHGVVDGRPDGWDASASRLAEFGLRENCVVRPAPQKGKGEKRRQGGKDLVHFAPLGDFC